MTCAIVAKCFYFNSCWGTFCRRSSRKWSNVFPGPWIS